MSTETTGPVREDIEIDDIMTGPPVEWDCIREIRDKILADTSDIVLTQQGRITTQKTFLSQLTFVLNKIREGLDLYNGFTIKMNTFLVNNEMNQSKLYAEYCRMCPEYGDYVEVLQDTPERIQVEGLESPVAQKELKALAVDVTSALYASGMEVKANRLLCKNINNFIPKRRDIYVEQKSPFASWFDLLETEVKNLTWLVDNLFTILSYVAFAKSETSPSPVLDLSKISGDHLL